MQTLANYTKSTMTEPRTLTTKEQRVVDEFEASRPGFGAIAERYIRDNHLTGWADIIENTPEEELTAKTGYGSNSFIYRRIGG
ncbi:hypothetical protein NIES4103_27560 [Nostoc sp. NIES-4103]|nr:hypothetical protein NIES4103_27560 [Nostoc sp. NIES-4103]